MSRHLLMIVGMSINLDVVSCNVSDTTVYTVSEAVNPLPVRPVTKRAMIVRPPKGITVPPTEDTLALLFILHVRPDIPSTTHFTFTYLQQPVLPQEHLSLTGDVMRTMSVVAHDSYAAGPCLLLYGP
jgi:hypothetical protein